METQRLIEEIRKYPFLYDHGHPEYKNIARRAAKWSEIGLTLNLEGEIVKKKWRNLRDCYIKFLKLDNTAPTSPAANKYRKWPWINHLHFLSDSYESEAPSIESQTVETPSPNLTEPAAESIVRNKSISPSQVPPPPKRTKTRNSNKNVQKSINRIYNKNRPKRRYDEIDHLFLSYSETFKRFSARRQATMKMALANLFGQAELSEIDEQHPPPPSPSSRSSVGSDHKVETDYMSNHSNISVESESSYILPEVKTPCITSNGMLRSSMQPRQQMQSTVF